VLDEEWIEAGDSHPVLGVGEGHVGVHAPVALARWQPCETTSTISGRRTDARRRHSTGVLLAGEASRTWP
jgi:hypothetical protein